MNMLRQLSDPAMACACAVIAGAANSPCESADAPFISPYLRQPHVTERDALINRLAIAVAGRVAP